MGDRRTHGEVVACWQSDSMKTVCDLCLAVEQTLHECVVWHETA